MAQSWSELSPRTRTLLVALMGLEATLLVAAQVDLTRRPAARVSGSKAKCRILAFVNLIGPLAYFLYGRK